MNKITFLTLALLLPLMALAADKPIANSTGLEFIDTSFENASPLWYEFADDNSIQVHLLYDHERNSSNCAAIHFHFRLHAKPGSKLTLELRNMDNIYEGRLDSIAKVQKLVVVSQDGHAWRPVATELLPESRVRLTVEMPGPQLYIARVEPYRITDLDRLLAEIRNSPLRSNHAHRQDRPRPRTGNRPRRRRTRALSRVHPAQAHSWEPGGNWVVEGTHPPLAQG